jgi:hypothetical protein
MFDRFRVSLYSQLRVSFSVRHGTCDWEAGHHRLEECLTQNYNSDEYAPSIALVIPVLIDQVGRVLES